MYFTEANIYIQMSEANLEGTIVPMNPSPQINVTGLRY
jgi:hypothetical protein